MALPQFEFHIAAYTLMADSLMEMDKYSNVFLYPPTFDEQVDYLVSQATICFDINKSQGFKDKFIKFIASGILFITFLESKFANSVIITELIFETGVQMIQFLSHLSNKFVEYNKLKNKQNLKFSMGEGEI